MPRKLLFFKYVILRKVCEKEEQCVMKKGECKALAKCTIGQVLEPPKS